MKNLSVYGLSALLAVAVAGCNPGDRGVAEGPTEPAQTPGESSNSADPGDRPTDLSMATADLHAQQGSDEVDAVTDEYVKVTLNVPNMT